MITGIVLSGGKSLRMGFDKCFLKYKNKTFIQNAVDLLESVSDKILLSSNNPDFEKFNCQIVKDLYSSIGPIGGIYSALKKSNSEINIVIPCDLPHLTVDLLNYMLSKIDNYDVVVLVFNNKVEPLVGIYRKRILQNVEKSIKSKNYKILSLLENVNTLFLPITEDYSFYSDNLFDNINTKDDFEKLNFKNTRN